MKKAISAILALVVSASILTSCGLGTQVKIERGTTTATQYTNESIGVTFTLPSDWRFYTESEMASAANMSEDLFKDENIFDSAEITSVMEFFAVEATTGTENVNLTVENLKTSNSADITLEEYAETAKNLLKEQVSGMTYTFGESSTVSLGEDDYLRIQANCSYLGVSMTQYMYIKKVGVHMVIITATSVNGNPASTFEAMFS